MGYFLTKKFARTESERLEYHKVHRNVGRVRKKKLKTPPSPPLDSDY
jgi:hypothetical protein